MRKRARLPQQQSQIVRSIEHQLNFKWRHIRQTAREGFERIGIVGRHAGEVHEAYRVFRRLIVIIPKSFHRNLHQLTVQTEKLRRVAAVAIQPPHAHGLAVHKRFLCHPFAKRGGLTRAGWAH